MAGGSVLDACHRVGVLWQYWRNKSAAIPPPPPQHLALGWNTGRPQIAAPKWSLFRAEINSSFVIRPLLGMAASRQSEGVDVDGGSTFLICNYHRLIIPPSTNASIFGNLRQI